jgi:uncharacterized protein YutE (UPF0331/DUF86 family)
LTDELHTLEAKFERLKEQVIHLKNLAGKVKSAEDLKNDFAKEAAAERLFQIALEVTLDIGRMIISMENLPRPETNDEIFGVLSKAGIIPQKYAKKAFGMGRFRNILVHGYMIVDENRIFENLQKLSLFAEYTKYISEYILKKLEK